MWTQSTGIKQSLCQHKKKDLTISTYWDLFADLSKKNLQNLSEFIPNINFDTIMISISIYINIRQHYFRGFFTNKLVEILFESVFVIHVQHFLNNISKDVRLLR